MYEWILTELNSRLNSLWEVTNTSKITYAKSKFSEEIWVYKKHILSGILTAMEMNITLVYTEMTYFAYIICGGVGAHISFEESYEYTRNVQCILPVCGPLK